MSGAANDHRRTGESGASPARMVSNEVDHRSRTCASDAHRPGDRQKTYESVDHREVSKNIGDTRRRIPQEWASATQRRQRQRWQNRQVKTAFAATDMGFNS